MVSVIRCFPLAAALSAMTALGGCELAPTAPVEKTIRVASYNTFLNRPERGALIKDLKTPGNVQARKVAEIIQRTAPDVLLLNEFDYDAVGQGLALFQENYLQVSQNGASPVFYPYVYTSPVNTGVHSGHDLDRDGVVMATPGDRAYGGDAFGYGVFEGQYGMAILSKYPIVEGDVRTFQHFLWKDMPGALIPDDLETSAADDWYSDDALAVFRLSSKSHWDVPIMIGDEVVHILASHPTPPSFDGEEDRNGRRNYDENRFWADYISLDRAGYIYDDSNRRGGLELSVRFVIMGDLNADPADAGSYPKAIAQLLEHPAIQDAAPASNGSVEQAVLQGGINLTQAGAPATDTADFNDDPEAGVGNLRLDYVLPSKRGFQIGASGVFWPSTAEPHQALIGPGFPVESSDHRLVWVDLMIEPMNAE